MRFVFLLSVALMLGACQSAPSGIPPAPDARLGASPGTAIVIEARSSADGVPKEYEWIRSNLPGAKIEQQALVNDGARAYDRFEVQLPTGEKRAVYFDISSFFGRGL
jgi:hypothetical protein